jgi:hypothetical protein
MMRMAGRTQTGATSVDQNGAGSGPERVAGRAAAAFRYWPFAPWKAVVLTPLILLVLLIVWGVGQAQLPVLRLQEVPAGWVLLGIGILSILPVVLLTLDGFATSGGTIEVATVKIELASAATAQPGLIVPRNVTEQPGVPIADSDSHQILEVLKRSSGADVVVVDLEDGHAWWETRLLILCVGAARLGRPRIVVFTATQQGRTGMFVGWARPSDLRDQLLKEDPRYRQQVDAADGAARACRLSRAPDNPAAVNTALLPLGFGSTGNAPLPSHLEEQILAAALGRHVEAGGTRDIGSCRLRDLDVLRTSSLDRTASETNWFRAALQLDDDHVAVTDHGRYVAMQPRAEVVNAVLLALTDRAR